MSLNESNINAGNAVELRARVSRESSRPAASTTARRPRRGSPARKAAIWPARSRGARQGHARTPVAAPDAVSMTTLSTVAVTFGGHLGSVAATAANPARPQLANAAATSPQTPRRCSVSKRRRSVRLSTPTAAAVWATSNAGTRRISLTASRVRIVATLATSSKLAVRIQWQASTTAARNGAGGAFRSARWCVVQCGCELRA